MEKGDVIRVSIVRRADMGPEHFGIFDGDRGVYHFQGFNPSSAKIKWTTLSEFEDGGKARVCSYYEKVFSNDEIIRRAASKIGTNFGGYNLKNNNCEHFATWCAIGKRKSMQTGTINKEDEDRDIVEMYCDYQIDKWTKIGDSIDKINGSGDYEDDDRSMIRTIIESSTSIGFISKLFRK